MLVRVSVIPHYPTEMINTGPVVLYGERQGGTLPVNDDPVAPEEVVQDSSQAGGVHGRDSHFISG